MPVKQRQSRMIIVLLDRFEGKLTFKRYEKITRTSTDTALRGIQDLINKNVLVKVGESKKGAGYEIRGENTLH